MLAGLSAVNEIFSNFFDREPELDRSRKYMDSCLFPVMIGLSPQSNASIVFDRQLLITVQYPRFARDGNKKACSERPTGWIHTPAFSFKENIWGVEPRSFEVDHQSRLSVTQCCDSGLDFRNERQDLCFERFPFLPAQRAGTWTVVASKQRGPAATVRVSVTFARP